MVRVHVDVRTPMDAGSIVDAGRPNAAEAESPDGAASKRTKASDEATSPMALAILSGRTGSIEGTITTKRTFGPVRDLKMKGDAYCAKFSPAKPPEASIQQGKVGDAVVRLVFDSAFPVPSERVVVTQKECQYA